MSAIFDVGSRIGQAGAEFGAGLNGMVRQFLRQLPAPFRSEGSPPLRAGIDTRRRRDDNASSFGIAASAAEAIGDHEALREARSQEADDDEEEIYFFDSKGSGCSRRARSFMDLQFPNCQLRYVDGQGLTASAFLPVCGGLLQTQGRYPGETKFSFSCKNRRGTHITPMMQWPDKSFSLGLAHPIAWKRSGLVVRPSVLFGVCPTIGGSNPGLRAELIHSMKEELNLICGYARNLHPSAYALVHLGRSKWNGNVRTSGADLRVEFPLSNIGRPFLSLQLNSGFDF